MTTTKDKLKMILEGTYLTEGLFTKKEVPEDFYKSMEDVVGKVQSLLKNNKYFKFDKEACEQKINKAKSKKADSATLTVISGESVDDLSTSEENAAKHKVMEDILGIVKSQGFKFDGKKSGAYGNDVYNYSKDDIIAVLNFSSIPSYIEFKYKGGN
jgi:hypothetical protein